jgi:hypothetical protein
MRFFASGFFHKSSFSKPLKIILGSFQIFPTGSPGALLVLTTLASNLPLVSTILVAN